MKRPIYLIVLTILISCSKDDMQSIEFRGIYATSQMGFEDASYVEIDIEGYTVKRNVTPVNGGMRSEPFEVPVGWNWVTRVEVYNDSQEITHYAKPLDSLGTLGGLVTTGVPFKTSANVVQQIFMK
nr:hypothetical protein [uncultured Allomuricauda sp.]